MCIQKKHVCDLDIPISISISKKDHVDLKNLVIFYPMALSWILAHKDGRILFVGMDIIFPLSKREEGKTLKL